MSDERIKYLKPMGSNVSLQAVAYADYVMIMQEGAAPGNKRDTIFVSRSNFELLQSLFTMEVQDKA